MYHNQELLFQAWFQTHASLQMKSKIIFQTNVKEELWTDKSIHFPLDYNAPKNYKSERNIWESM